MNRPPASLRPWYRQPWPWLLMAPPAASIALGIAMWALAARSDDGLVANDYYKRGLEINRRVRDATPRAESRLGAVVRVDERGEVVARIEGLADPADATPVIRLRIAQPSHAVAERVVVLARDAAGDYVGRLDPPSEGRWVVTLESTAWRLPTTTVSGRLTELKLGSTAQASPQRTR
jgi:hypothetical protein